MRRAKELKLAIPFKWVAITAYAILMIPILIFFAGWLKWYFAIVFSGILLFGAYWVIKKDYWDNSDCIEMSVGILIGAVVVFTFWVMISGNCHISVGNVDTIWRNTSLCDLVNYDWPVYYPDTNGYFCYYFIFWLIPALVGKLFGGMTVAFIALGCWFVLILMTTFLLITYYFKDYKKSTLKTIIVFMIMWSGIKILAKYLFYKFGITSTLPTFGNAPGYCDALFNGEAFHFLFRSNEDFLCNPYNQLPIWIVVPLMLQNRRIHNYAFLGLIMFPFSPWGTAGIAFIMFTDAVYFLVKEKSIKSFIKETFSIPNLSAIFSVFLVFQMFISSVNSFEKGAQKFGILDIGTLTPQMVQGIFIFFFCEFGIYYLITWKKYRKDYLYVSILVMLLVMPFIWVSARYIRDFCADATLPQLYILMIYMIGYVKDEVLNRDISFYKKLNFKNCILLIVLALSFADSVFNWVNKINAMNTQQSMSIQNRSVSTFADLLGYEGNFVAPISEDVDEAVFFKYFAKSVDKENSKRLPISDNLSDIRSIEDINQYFDYLTGKNCIVFIAVQDIPGYNLTQATTDKMKQIGFSDEIDTLLQKEYHSFIGIVNNGQIITEQIGGDEYITYSGESQINGKNVWMESGTWNHGNLSVINIGNGYYSAHGRGLNIVVWDNEAGRVIDSVAFDTHATEITCTRKRQ